MFGAYLQPGAVRDGAFGGLALGADVPADVLVYLTPSALQIWQLAMGTARACKVPSPSVDTVLTLSVDPACPLLSDTLASVTLPTNVTLVQQSALLNWTANPNPLTTAAVQVVVTANPQVIAQLAGPTGGYAIVYPADAQNPVVVAARPIARLAAVAAAEVAKAKASIFANPTTTALVVGGGAALLFFLLRKKKR